MIWQFVSCWQSLNIVNHFKSGMYHKYFVSHWKYKGLLLWLVTNWCQMSKCILINVKDILYKYTLPWEFLVKTMGRGASKITEGRSPEVNSTILEAPRPIALIRNSKLGRVYLFYILDQTFKQKRREKRIMAYLLSFILSGSLVLIFSYPNSMKSKF